jgi:lipopolysaccharide export system protein LptA
VIKRCTVAITLCLAFAAMALAAGKVGDDRNAQPIKIKANELVTDNNNRTSTFVGKVSARQGDLTIFSDKLVINYSEKDHEVEKVEAFGNVRILQGNRQALAGHALYDNKAGKIILDTAPKVYQGDDVISGNVITYLVDEQKSVVTGGPDARVEAVIHPRDKGKNGSAKP